MVRHVEAIFSGGAFRPLEPLALPEGTRVHLRVEDDAPASAASAAPGSRVAKIHSPRLARREDAADFVMEVRENGDARL
jgi:predicted DNA-binding antitoxin AbrB/MazE fold protein